VHSGGLPCLAAQGKTDPDSEPIIQR